MKNVSNHWENFISSHPHGCVSWNVSIIPPPADVKKSHPHGCVSWNVLLIHLYAFLMSHPHGCVSWNVKLTKSRRDRRGHTLTGVWVEMWRIHSPVSGSGSSHPHGCVSWNFTQMIPQTHIKSHPHGCVSWNLLGGTKPRFIESHPHGCVSWNHRITLWCHVCSMSHPHGCVSWNRQIIDAVGKFRVTPSRVCELKCQSLYR